MSGGGSIPFEAVRLGLSTYSSDINPMPIIIQKAAIEFPAKFGKNLTKYLEKYTEEIANHMSDKLSQYTCEHENEKNDGFIWANVINCPNPDCNLKIPLSPNWKLSNKKKKGLKLITPNFGQNKCNFQVVDLEKVSEGTIKRGVGKCPRCQETFSTDYIRNEFTKNRIEDQLIAVVFKEFGLKGKTGSRNFRLPSKDDLVAIEELNNNIEKNILRWKKSGLLPEEDIPNGQNTRELINKGFSKWFELFNNRQLLTNLTILEEINKLKTELKKNPEINDDLRSAIITLLQFGFNKVINYNSKLTVWMSLREVVVNTFNRHDFSVSWSYSEMNILNGFKWAMKNVLKAYKGLTKLNTKKENLDFHIKRARAQNLQYLNNEEIALIVVDPPYYDNVMYAELSDFFYVWTKITLESFYPELFSLFLTDKDNEAVANPSKFEGMGQSKRLLARQDYEIKMRDSFIEMHRVLKKQGLLIIMFTHKATDAWDTLAMSLMEAGFEITASWPVHTESNISMHIAKKNAVKSTIFLVCRKRLKIYQDVWWEDDVLPEIKKIVKKKAKQFEKDGISGVDLFISSFGPALNEFSKYYPVKDIEGNEIRAEKALKVAREIVTEIVLKRILKRSINIDLVSKYYIIAWEIYRARIIPFDEARNLAISIGINIDDLKAKKILKKKSGDVEILSPSEREKIGAIDIENPNDKGIIINAVQIAMLAYQDGGQKKFEQVVAKMRRDSDKSFRQYMEALYNILPDVKDLEEKKILAQILVSTEEKITPKGGKLDDYI